MMISKEADYALRILNILSDNERHKVKDISDNEVIPKLFAYKIINKLEDASYIKCFRGKYGGIELNCNLKDISLYELFEAIDNECLIIECLRDDYKCIWEEKTCKTCYMYHTFNKLQESINNKFKDIDLHTLLTRR